MQYYIGVVHKDPDSNFGVSFPDFPGCVTAGRTLAEAVEMAHEALEFHAEALADHGYAIPEPSTIEAVRSDPDWQDGVAVLVRGPQTLSQAA